MSESRELLLRPTIAVNASSSVISQCAHCSALVSWYRQDGRTLGPCCVCGCHDWIGQDLEVGPFVVGFPESERRVLNDVVLERRAQDMKFGEQNLPDGTSAVRYRHIADLTRRICQCAGEETTWRHVLLEEVYEALAEVREAALEAELIQVAAVAVAWVGAIRRRR